MIHKVIFIGAGPGDAELITVKGLKCLQQAEVVFYDSLIDPALLEGLTAELIYVGKRRGEHAMPQEEINQFIAGQARKGKRVVRLKGGDCSVFGRLGEELLHLAQEHIPYEVVPGVTSSTAAPVFAGIPVTHRGLADSFYVVTAHRRPLLNHMEISIPPYSPSTTIVLMMALSTNEVWQKKLLEQGYPDDLPVAYISCGGTPKQKVLVTTVGNASRAASETPLDTPVMAIVGRVVTLREQLRWYLDSDEARPEALSKISEG